MGYTILFWSAWFISILVCLNIVYKISKRLFLSQEHTNVKERVKQIIFMAISLPITAIALIAFAAICVFSIWAGYEYVARIYSEQFLAGACFPAVYPTGEILKPTVTGEVTTYESQDDSEAIAAFLTEKLDAIPIATRGRRDEYLWLMSQLDDDSAPGYLFQCSMYYENGLYEYGCIHITERDKGSMIETKWDILTADFPYSCGV
jgi:hypothetical protein